jgi:hypothetical protein
MGAQRKKVNKTKCRKKAWQLINEKMHFRTNKRLIYT